MAQKVYVGMSGGVDSSLAASLLVQQGYDVTGVYMKNWTNDLPGMRCPWAEDLSDAKRVAVHLNIPFKVVDFQKDYKKLVVDYMIKEYSRGVTPNPDIMCNQMVKFGLFLDIAKKSGADKIATGHYARSSGTNLLMSKNFDKDQTYFLYRISSEAVSRAIFPIGEYSSKEDVRQMAESLGLKTARKKDSQGICFVGTVGIKDFLSQYVKTSPGDIVDKLSGSVIGKHDGALFYTLGQRHGLDVGGGLPYYVVGKDMAKNIVYVSRDINDDAFWRHDFTITSLSWINLPPIDGKEYKVRLRHRGKLFKAIYKSIDKNTANIHIDEPERVIASGQSAVLYDGDIVLGGGIII